jgi:hypothetical protein
MSTYSEAWAAMNPAVRDFYRNWADINSAQSWHAEWWDAFQFWLPFYTMGISWPGYLGFHIAQRNWGIQTALSGSFNPDTVLLCIPATTWTGLLEPQYDQAENGSYSQFWDVVPVWAINFPREKYKVRKSYWTGAPRRRRNL